MTTPEIPKTPSESSTFLLSRLRSTLDGQWGKFDISLPALKTLSTQYNTLKSGYDALSTELSQISDDEKLKANTSIQSKIDNFLIEIAQHLTDATRDKQYDNILQETQSKVSSLRNQIFGESQTPSVQVEVKNLGTEAIAATTVAVNEGISSLKSEVGGVKKNPIGKLIEAIGWDSQKVGSGLKEAFAEKKAGGLEGIFAGLKIFFWGFIAKIGGLNIGSYFSQEEIAAMDPKIRESIGLQNLPKPESGIGTQDPENKMEQSQKKYPIIAAGITKIAPQEAQKGGISALLSTEKITDSPIGDLKKYYQDPKKLLDFIGNPGGIEMPAANYLLRILFDESSNLHSIIRGRFSKVYPDKNIEQSTLKEVLSVIGTDIHILSVFRSIDITNIQESIGKMGASLFSYDSQKGEISGELVEKARGLGISNGLMIKLLAIDNKTSFNDEKSLEALKQTSGVTEKDKQKIDEIASFGVSFLNTLKTNEALNLGNGQQVANILNKKNISFGDIMKSYLLTGGESDMMKMDTVQKIGAYTAFMLIIGQDSEASGATMGSIINVKNAYELYKNGTDPFDKIPDDVKTFFKDTISLESVWKIIENTLGGMADYVKAFSKESPGFASFMILAVVFLPIFAKRTNIASMFMGK